MSRDPMLKVMKAYGNDNPTREEYINFIYAGTPPVDEAGDLPAELEAELPRQFQRIEKVTHEQEAAAEEKVKAMVDECIAKLERGLTNDDFTRRTSGDEGTR